MTSSIIFLLPKNVNKLTFNNMNTTNYNTYDTSPDSFLPSKPIPNEFHELIEQVQTHIDSPFMLNEPMDALKSISNTSFLSTSSSKAIRMFLEPSVERSQIIAHGDYQNFIITDLIHTPSNDSTSNNEFVIYQEFKETNENLKWALINIIKYQQLDGHCVLKINHSNVFSSNLGAFKSNLISLKSVLYVMSSLYKSVFIFKNSADLLSKTFYIIGNEFTSTAEDLNELLNKMSVWQTEPSKDIIHIAYHYAIKLNDVFLMLKQQYDDEMNYVTNVCKNKTREEKIEFLKKQLIKIRGTNGNYNIITF